MTNNNNEEKKSYVYVGEEGRRQGGCVGGRLGGCWSRLLALCEHLRHTGIELSPVPLGRVQTRDWKFCN